MANDIYLLVTAKNAFKDGYKECKLKGVIAQNNLVIGGTDRTMS